MSPPLTDPGVPSYVKAGYVKPGYQKYYSSVSGAPPGTPPLQGVDSQGPTTPPNWPSLPPTLPPVGCPPLNSVWSTGPVEPSTDQIGYTPPVSNPNDDGLSFPISFGDVALANGWHGLPSVMNPLNIALYQLQLDQIIHDAIAQANTTRTVSLGLGAETLTFPVSPFYDIQVAVETAVLKDMLQGTALWYELVLKPLTNGPFANYYVVSTTSMDIVMGINLSA